jgi:hypothetical protein
MFQTYQKALQEKIRTNDRVGTVQAILDLAEYCFNNKKVIKDTIFLVCHDLYDKKQRLASIRREPEFEALNARALTLLEQFRKTHGKLFSAEHKSLADRIIQEAQLKKEEVEKAEKEAAAQKIPSHSPPQRSLSQTDFFREGKKQKSEAEVEPQLKRPSSPPRPEPEKEVTSYQPLSLELSSSKSSSAGLASSK